MVECAMFRKVDLMSRTDGMASSVAGSNPYGLFPVGTLERACLYCPSQTIEDLVAEFEAAVTMVDINVLRCVQKNDVHCTAVCLEMDGDHFKHLL
jgi:hypothetical protein